MFKNSLYWHIDDFSVLMKKLYTYNAASSIIAYFGWLKGYSVYSMLQMIEKSVKF